MDGNKLSFGEQAVFSKRIYEASDWPAFRASAKAQTMVANTPVILTK